MLVPSDHLKSEERASRLCLVGTVESVELKLTIYSRTLLAHTAVYEAQGPTRTYGRLGPIGLRSPSRPAATFKGQNTTSTKHSGLLFPV